MGACFSNRIKAGSPIHEAYEGVNSTNVSRDGNNLSSNGNTSVPITSSTSRSTEVEILRPFHLKSFTFNELRTATGDFCRNGLLGEGGFGTVYKGWVDEHSLTATETKSTGLVIAVKRLNTDGSQGHKEWLAEINYLGQLHHPNLVKLIGYCLEDFHRLLVYEFMPLCSVENHLFRKFTHFRNNRIINIMKTKDSNPQPLPWSIRMKVALGAAKGLAFLHMAERQVIYRNFNTSEILLDSNYNAKLSDFGLARDGPTGDKTHVSTRVIGAYGYGAPEYISTGHLSTKCDVYSFGVVLLELLSGRRTLDKSLPLKEQKLVEWAKPKLINKNKIFRILDARLEGLYSPSQALQVAKLALRCLSQEAKLRPNMDEVVTTLEQIRDSEDTVNGGTQRARAGCGRSIGAHTKLIFSMLH